MLILAAAPALCQADLAGEVQELRSLVKEQQEALRALRLLLEQQQQRIANLESGVAHPNGELRRATDPHAVAKMAPPPTPSDARPAKWYERFNVNGYGQFRYNRLLETNPNLKCAQCDASIGSNGGLFIRRARVVFSGDVTERIFLYLQPDFASASSTGLHFGQMRDFYADLSLDKKKEFRIRIGQSKVPFGFENLQSSGNRISLDRADGTNSAVVNERDLGVYLMYAPARIRDRFRHLVVSGLKGSGDYGVVAGGFFNGQDANRPEANNNLHRVARLTYPFQLRNGRFIEAGIQAYTGQYTVTERGTLTQGPSGFLDRRAAATLVIYPQRLGFQAEYNFGKGPVYNPLKRTIEVGGLQGGYAQLMYRTKVGSHYLIPYFKTHYYNGGKKYELDARRYLVREQEIGVEWAPSRLVELVGAYSIADRTYEDSANPNNRQKGNLMRLQLQFNY